MKLFRDMYILTSPTFIIIKSYLERFEIYLVKECILNMKL